MNKLLSLLISFMIVLLLLGACSKEELGEEPESLPPKDEAIIEEPEEVTYLSMEPFTGVMTEEENKTRPVLATINNHPLARPQSGISDADIIYEYLAEGNVTRLLALFQSKLPDEIGPIRSARDYFIFTAKGLDAFYVAHGYSPDALALLQSKYVDHINGMQHDGTLFKRSKERKAPHNSYISSESIYTAMENLNVSMEINKIPPLSFHEAQESVKIGDSAKTIVVENGTHPDFTSTYTYDNAKGMYNRAVNDILTIDKTNDKQVELANILVFETNYNTIDSEGRQSVDIESGGKALLFQSGVTTELDWANIDGVLVPVENGEPAKLVPGKTWIHIISNSPGIESAVSFTP